MSINLTQRFEYETDSLESFEKVLDTMVRVMYKETPSQYAQLFLSKNSPSFENGRKWIGTKGMSASDPKGWSKPLYLNVCTVGDYRSDMQKGDEQFERYADLVKKVMDNIKNPDFKSFQELCGDGYTSWFNHMDGSVELGFRINQRPLGGWDFLDVSLCHIYYGK